jgi:hypothetical protein
VHIACHYPRIGEVNGNLTGLLAARGISAKFDVGADSAPAIYVHGQPGRTTRAVRALERATARLTGHDLATGQHHVKLTNYIADPVELKILHMVTGDPKRTPTMVMFGNADFWLTGGPVKCGASCFTEPAGTDAWNHGTVGSQINTTWLGLAGPGVSRLGVDNAVWSDHTNIQPTMMALLGLRDDYMPDGRVLAEVIAHGSMPAAMRAHLPVLLRLGRAYSAIEAPVGPFGLATLRASTVALASATRGDSRYATMERALARLGAARDRVARQMRTMLDGAAFAGTPLNVPQANALVHQARRLLREAGLLAH